MMLQNILLQIDGPIWTITLNRPEVRNAIDGETAHQLANAFKRFDADSSASVAVLTGNGQDFCAGADLKSVAAGAFPIDENMHGNGPLGPTRMQLNKPIIAAVSGHAVAGGLELALWCDLRVADTTAIFGVYCRRFGVPLIDGGTVRLPRLIGQSRAMDMILTGRPVLADEALSIGLANRVAPAGQALAQAQALASELAAFPQQCLRNDRKSSLEQWALGTPAALAHEFSLGLQTMQSGETQGGAAKFTTGKGRHGQF